MTAFIDTYKEQKVEEAQYVLSYPSPAVERHGGWGAVGGPEVGTVARVAPLRRATMHCYESTCNTNDGAL